MAGHAVRLRRGLSQTTVVVGAEVATAIYTWRMMDDDNAPRGTVPPRGRVPSCSISLERPQYPLALREVLWSHFQEALDRDRADELP